MQHCREGKESWTIEASDPESRQHHLRPAISDKRRKRLVSRCEFAAHLTAVHSLTNEIKSVTMACASRVGEAGTIVATNRRPSTRTSVNTTAAPQWAATSMIRGARILVPVAGSHSFVR